MPKKKFAVFDIDGTIFRSSLLIELVEELISQGKISPAVREEYSKAHEDWLNRKESYEKYINAVVTAFKKNIRDLREDELIRVIEKVIEVHQYRVYRYTRDLIKDLKEKNYFLLAISFSPKYIVDRFGKNLGFDKIYGTLLEIGEDGKFTGTNLKEDLIFDKAKILRRAVEKEDLTMEGSVGVGDTESDIAFLSLVERPICFNPNSKLNEAAKKNHWPVVVERKDVIYTMEN
jgi:HAD superfamily hydrolase (TIGR01490 family)